MFLLSVRNVIYEGAVKFLKDLLQGDHEKCVSLQYKVMFVIWFVQNCIRQA